MILVYVKEKNGETVVWDLNIKYAKSQRHLVNRINRLLKKEYGDEPFEILNGMVPINSKC